MRLTANIEVYGGGPGSGCNPEKGKCGRPIGTGRMAVPQKIKAYEKTLRQHGFKFSHAREHARYVDDADRPGMQRRVDAEAKVYEWFDRSIRDPWSKRNSRVEATIEPDGRLVIDYLHSYPGRRGGVDSKVKTFLRTRKLEELVEFFKGSKFERKRK